MNNLDYWYFFFTNKTRAPHEEIFDLMNPFLTNLQPISSTLPVELMSSCMRQSILIEHPKSYQSTNVSPSKVAT